LVQEGGHDGLDDGDLILVEKQKGSVRVGGQLRRQIFGQHTELANLETAAAGVRGNIAGQ